HDRYLHSCPTRRSSDLPTNRGRRTIPRTPNPRRPGHPYHPGVGTPRIYGRRPGGGVGGGGTGVVNTKKPAPNTGRAGDVGRSGGFPSLCPPLGCSLADGLGNLWIEDSADGFASVSGGVGDLFLGHAVGFGLAYGLVAFFFGGLGCLVVSGDGVA